MSSQELEEDEINEDSSECPTEILSLGQADVGDGVAQLSQIGTGTGTILMNSAGNLGVNFSNSNHSHDENLASLFVPQKNSGLIPILVPFMDRDERLQNFVGLPQLLGPIFRPDLTVKNNAPSDNVTVIRNVLPLRMPLLVRAPLMETGNTHNLVALSPGTVMPPNVETSMNDVDLRFENVQLLPHNQLLDRKNEITSLRIKNRAKLPKPAPVFNSNSSASKGRSFSFTPFRSANSRYPRRMSGHKPPVVYREGTAKRKPLPKEQPRVSIESVDKNASDEDLLEQHKRIRWLQTELKEQLQKNSPAKGRKPYQKDCGHRRKSKIPRAAVPKTKSPSSSRKLKGKSKLLGQTPTVTSKEVKPPKESSPKTIKPNPTKESSPKTPEQDDSEKNAFLLALDSYLKEVKEKTELPVQDVLHLHDDEDDDILTDVLHLHDDEDDDILIVPPRPPVSTRKVLVTTSTAPNVQPSPGVAPTLAGVPSRGISRGALQRRLATPSSSVAVLPTPPPPSGQGRALLPTPPPPSGQGRALLPTPPPPSGQGRAFLPTPAAPFILTCYRCGCPHHVWDCPYIDYGTKCCVKREQIRLIKKTFMHFNSQAIRARLAGLKPVDSLDLWNLDSGYRLLELTKERKLQCKAITYDYEKGISLELHVNDDNGYDLCVNDVLVDEGFAEPNDNELEELRSLYNSENSEYQVESYENPTAENVPFVQQPIINHYSTLEEETQSNRISKYTPGFDKSILEKLSEKVLREKQASDFLDCRTPSPEPETEEAEIPFVARVAFQHPSLSSQPTANVQPNIGHATPNEPITQIVEPEASHKTTAQQNLTNPTMNAINGDSQEASSCVTSRRYVKKVKLPMNCHGHFINYNSKLFLTSGDISHFIYGSNVLLKMVHRLIKFQDLEMIRITRNECPALFDELAQYKVRGFEDTSTQYCCVVTLVPLESCIKALEKVHTNREEPKLALQDALDNFDPLDPCWMQTKNDTSKEQNEIETPEFIQEQFLKLSAERKVIAKRLFEEDYSLETHLEYQSVTEKFRYYHELCQTIETAQSEKLLKSIEELSLKNEAYSNISNERHRNVRSVEAAAPISAFQTPVSSTQVRNMISAATNNNFTGIPLSANVTNPYIFYPNSLSQPNMIFPNMQYMQQYLYQQDGAPPFQSETLFNNNVAFPQGFFSPLNKHP